ncbi:unnamed protein product [Periconia digitata]|uniref:Uncharacterized protein n=1 Tax=Periconia digitata TaxID=1303443 RepID=A0A9W4XKD7_9PLEO|nr:unnamed protein product [Periconia digitata]
MRLFAILAILAPVLTKVDATCNKAWFDPHWPITLEQTASYALGLCRTDLNGTYRQDETRRRCAQVAYQPVNAQFSITWTGWGHGNITDVECFERLMDEITGCESGGMTRAGGWLFIGIPTYNDCPVDIN